MHLIYFFEVLPTDETHLNHVLQQVPYRLGSLRHSLLQLKAVVHVPFHFFACYIPVSGIYNLYIHRILGQKRRLRKEREETNLRTNKLIRPILLTQNFANVFYPLLKDA